MFPLEVVVFSLLAGTCCSLDLPFPEGFQFGSASAAFQVEGGWNASDKGVSIWDHYTHTQPHKIKDNTNGDVACDSYYQWKKDVQFATDLGLDFYRFSIAWPRILPSGFNNYVSEDGKKYYNNLINELLKNGIQPMITIYHWDLPQKLQDLGGWANPLTVDWFVDYAEIVLSLFADRVKLWITLNEPIAICDCSYSDLYLAPAIYDPDHAMYLCNRHVLLAHAKVWRLFDTKFRPKYGGIMSITNHFMFIEGETESDSELAEITMQLSVGRFSHAIFSQDGGWPPTVEKVIAENSIKKGYTRSRLPPFTKEEIDLIKGTYDFYGVNYYTTRTVRKAKPGEKLRDWFFGDAPEVDGIFGFRKEWQGGASALYANNPPGLRHTMRWLRKQYGDINLIITENGYSDKQYTLDDNDRINFIKQHLEQVLLCIHEDKLNITHYTYWSMLDNFEWMDGYTVKFGLYEVDFEDAERKRTARKSAYYYRDVINANSIDVPVEPDRWLHDQELLSPRSSQNAADAVFSNISVLLLPLVFMLLN